MFENMECIYKNPFCATASWTFPFFKLLSRQLKKICIKDLQSGEKCALQHFKDEYRIKVSNELVGQAYWDNLMKTWKWFTTTRKFRLS